MFLDSLGMYVGAYDEVKGHFVRLAAEANNAHRPDLQAFRLSTRASKKKQGSRAKYCCVDYVMYADHAVTNCTVTI